MHEKHSSSIKSAVGPGGRWIQAIDQQMISEQQLCAAPAAPATTGSQQHDGSKSQRREMTASPCWDCGGHQGLPSASCDQDEPGESCGWGKWESQDPMGTGENQNKVWQWWTKSLCYQWELSLTEEKKKLKMKLCTRCCARWDTGARMIETS